MVLTRKARRLDKVTRAAQAAAKAATAHNTAQDRRDKAILEARSEPDPATYQEIADAASVTKDRVSQIIQAQRKQA